jgi:hypothetical protein
MGEQIMTADAKIDLATERVLATIGDHQLAARYPDRTHFISSQNPDQGQLATQALFSGDAVAIVYPDGHELLIRPEQVGGLPALFQLAAAFFLRLAHRGRGELMQLPPRTHVEARDSSGHPIAA